MQPSLSLQDNRIDQGEAFHFMALFLAMAKTRAISVLRMAYRKNCIMLFPLQKACLMRSVFCPREALLYIVLVVLVLFPPHQAASKQRKQPYHSIFRMNLKNSYNIIMVLFEGIGDNIKSENDIFIQEIEHAREYEKPIIPFYADGYDFSDILKNENIPSIIKNVVSIQHSIVKYDHANREKTYDLLLKQLNTRLILKILSQHNSCSMSCQMNKGLIGESKEIKENDYSIIEIDRDFTGQIHLYFYAKELMGEFKRTINFDQTAILESLKNDLNLIRKNITGSDYIVELDANSVSGLM